MRRALLRVVGVVAVFRGLFVACVGDDLDLNDEKSAGDEGGACFIDGTCRSGLACASGLCVRVSGGQDAAPTPVADTSTSEPPPGPDGDASADASKDASPDVFVPPPDCAGQVPCTVPNLFAWYRADRGVIVTPGNRVAEWQDQSEKGHHAFVDDAGSSPTLHDAGPRFDAGPFLEFNGGAGLTTPQRLMTQVFTTRPTAPLTVYLAMSVEDPGRSVGHVFDGREPQRSAVVIVGGSGQLVHPLIVGPTLEDLSNVTLGASVPMILEVTLDGPQSTLGVSGDAGVATMGLDDFQPPTGFTLGSAAPGTPNNTGNFGGYVAEVIVYSGAHARADRDKVIGWLRGRHGI